MIRIAAALVLLLAQEKENPEYSNWANCRPGSWVKNRIAMENQGKKVEYESVTRLEEVTPDKVVLEILMKMKVGDKSVDSPPKKHEIKSKGPNPGKTIVEREEEVTIAGKTLSCRYHEIETEAAEKKPKVNLKAWISKDIPGGVAKSEVLSEGMTAPIRTQALEWEKK
ncbi:MAG: hypothetical protein HY293_20005 [Planctomycetes bacterium]|nr:hypothetical protein [Planctomycetota bacterium]